MRLILVKHYHKCGNKNDNFLAYLAYKSLIL